MKRCLGVVDATHLPAYLETPNPRNISFYQRHSFEITGQAQAGACPPCRIHVEICATDLRNAFTRPSITADRRPLATHVARVVSAVTSRYVDEVVPEVPRRVPRRICRVRRLWCRTCRLTPAAH